MTAKWTTVATVGYTGSVSSRQENRAAHGAVCLLQARRGKTGIIGRHVNSNGGHAEVGEPFSLDDETLSQWQAIAKAAR